MTQTEEILDYLRHNKSISIRESVYYMFITRLAARIHDLRKMGYVIEDQYITVTKRNGQKVTVKEYTLKETV